MCNLVCSNRSSCHCAGIKRLFTQYISKIMQGIMGSKQNRPWLIWSLLPGGLHRAAGAAARHPEPNGA
jgi:hypothetical protein